LSHRDRIRWLLRPLGEPAFLRLYRATTLESDCSLQPRYPRRLFEDTFWSLPADLEHPEKTRDQAWKFLKHWLPEGEQSALEWFCILLRHLREPEAGHADDIRDIAQFWAAPELFWTPGASSGEPRLDDYHELHCHLRGAVPFSQLWHGWITDAHARARLRTHHCQAGSWKRTWAEIVNEAAKVWPRRLEPVREGAPRFPAGGIPAPPHDLVEILRDDRHWDAPRWYMTWRRAAV
jgi:hypothetical protein